MPNPPETVLLIEALGKISREANLVEGCDSIAQIEFAWKGMEPETVSLTRYGKC